MNANYRETDRYKWDDYHHLGTRPACESYRNHVCVYHNDRAFVSLILQPGGEFYMYKKY